MIDTCPYPAPTTLTFIDHKWEAFLYFVWEREAIRLARENGFEKPWTIDPILEKYRFCNIRRRDDRLTQWLIKNVYEPRQSSNDLWFIAAICRLINWPPTISKLNLWMALPDRAEEFDTMRFVSVIEDIIEEGEKAYGGAYMTYPGRETGSTKSEFIAKRILEPLILIAPEVRKAVGSNYVENVVDILASSFGLNTFLAGQVAADLTYFDNQLGEAYDLYEFAPIGPGSQEGLNYLMSNKKGTQWRQIEFNRTLRVANQKIKDACGIMDLTLHDVQNCMCEASKYFRAMLGDGKPRTLYKTETAY